MGSARSNYPGAAKRREIWIPAHEFAGIQDAGSWVPGATTQFLDYLMRLPDDFLAGEEVGFKAVWSAETASAADSATWRVLYSKLTNNTTDATGAPATALGTAIAADTKIATANAIQTTERGKIAVNVLSAMVAGADFLKLRVNLNAVVSMTIGTDKIDFYGLIVDYVPRYI